MLCLPHPQHLHTEEILPVFPVPRETGRGSRPKEVKALGFLGSLGKSFVLTFFFIILGIEPRALCSLKENHSVAELWSQPCVAFSLSPQHLLVSSFDHEFYTSEYFLCFQPSARCVAMESTVTSALGKAESNRAMWP